MDLFRKYYKEANDDIKPNRELIDKIFERAEKEHTPRRKVYRFAYAAAAAAAIAVSVYSYPQIVKFAESDVRLADSAENVGQQKSSTEKTADSAKKDSAEKTAERAAAPETAADKQENKVQERAEIIPKQKKTEKQKTETAAAEKDASAKVKTQSEVSDKGAASEVKVQNEVPDNGAAETVTQKEAAESNEAERGGTAAFSMETAEDSGGADSFGMAKIGGGSGASANGEYVLWSMENYYSYIGMNICEAADIPQDMKSLVPDDVYFRTKDGIPLDDTVSFSFCGDGDRSVNIVTSKKRNDDQSALEYQSTDGEMFSAGMRVRGVYAEVFAYGLTAEECESLMKSLR